MGKEEFREALFDATEAMIDYKISTSGRALIMSFFNDSKCETVLERAIECMVRYSGMDFPPVEKRSKKLKTALNRLAYEASLWDNE